MSIFMGTNGRDAALRRPRTSQRDVPTLERFHRLRLFNFFAAFLAGASSVIVPELAHGLAEMLNDVAAIEVNVFHKRAAILAIKNNCSISPRGPRRSTTTPHVSGDGRAAGKERRGGWW